MSLPSRKITHAQKSKRKPILLSILAILVLIIGIFMGYVSDYYEADETAYAFLETTETVQYRGDSPIHFSPVDEANTGIIFYPGGKVDEVAYTPVIHPLAEAGYEVFIVDMPFHLAVFDIDAADDIIENNPKIEHWYLSGHSLGAAMAASYAGNNIEKLDGLILLSGYSTADLSTSNLPVLSIYGTNDEVLNLEKLVEYQPNLPDNTIEQTIEGGNHAQFGRYGEQAGDGEAEISIEEQLAITVDSIQSFITENSP